MPPGNRRDPSDLATLGFTEFARTWFTESFVAPTAAQLGAWNAIGRGEHTLVIAPTGSGKTLAAFLWAIDGLAAPAPQITNAHSGTSVLYISPLKALAVDVERNLRAPLAGIERIAARSGAEPTEITVGIRTGDTPAAQRRRLITKPPDILITTPESLFLMLTSAARETLRGVHTVIVDEVHAVAGSKRGTHLALSLERLDALLAAPAQRIGLSATVEPATAVAEFLGGPAPVTIVAPPAEKKFELSISVPVEDMTDLTESGGSMWPHVDAAIVELITAHRSTIVFVNGRRGAERLTARLNELHAESLGIEHTSQHNPDVPGGAAAFVNAGGETLGAEPLLARAHHGSVSKETRAEIEEQLKSGELRCVVATSSLELGIDMGAVDLVIQVSAPSSAASGLQRVGRAGHQVGEPSRGVFFPNHRTDVIGCAVTVERMKAGQLEPLGIPQNPLDVLAQQTVAAAAMDIVDVEEWFSLVRRAAPYRNLPRSAYDAVLDLISGRYPAEEFGELRPRVNFDRSAGTLEGRPGAGRLAVTSGGAIPDRGMFGVFMVGEKASRVGELDEEMVYESRVGDVFALGATSWKIEDITHDRVLVSPAFGRPGRLPFWIGDTIGRPAVLGRAIGAFTREFAALAPPAREKRATTIGLDANALANLEALIDEQRAATEIIPSDRTLVLERFRDELGDWRLILHTPYGMAVNAPWALAVSARLESGRGITGATTATDDGIIIAVPDTDAEPPGADLFRFDPAEIEPIVTENVGGTALFASRFRECAARALLLPRRQPGKRAPLWLQRQRSAQLLEVAHRYPSFPIILETVREVLRDVYDVPALTELLADIAANRVRIAEVTTAVPSPFAAALLFDYVGSFIYEGDSPLAERRAAVLSLDTAVLAQLMGRIELRDLLDLDVIAAVEAALQRTADGYRARTLEQLADLIREVGPLTPAEIAERTDGPPDPPNPDLRTLETAGRVFRYRLAGREFVAAAEDAARIRDGLGVPLPPGLSTAFTQVDGSAGDSLAAARDLAVSEVVLRYSRTHGPFVAADIAARHGLAPAQVHAALFGWVTRAAVTEGEFSSELPTGQFCGTRVLGRIRQQSLALLRHDVEPVPPEQFARFLLAHHQIAGQTRTQISGSGGVAGVAAALDQLAGVAIPASALESLILPARVPDYQPRMLDELTASGEVSFRGAGLIGERDGWLIFHPTAAPPATSTGSQPDPLHQALLRALDTGGGFFYPALLAAARIHLPPDLAAPDVAPTDRDWHRALWELVWAGSITNDTLGPIRALLGGSSPSGPPRGQPAHRAARRGSVRARYSQARVVLPGDATTTGRWSLTTPGAPSQETQSGQVQSPREFAAESADLAQTLLDRYGVVTKGPVAAEGIPGGFARIYKTLSTFEDAGTVRRGYFIAGLGAAQFARTGTIDALRALAHPDEFEPGPGVVLAATDPANPYGLVFGWPRSDSRPGRKAGAIVVLVDGALAAYLERGARTITLFASDSDAIVASALDALAGAVRATRIESISVLKINGDSAFGHPFTPLFTAAGFTATPRGLRIR